MVWNWSKIFQQWVSSQYNDKTHPDLNQQYHLMMHLLKLWLFWMYMGNISFLNKKKRNKEKQGTETQRQTERDHYFIYPMSKISNPDFVSVWLGFMWHGAFGLVAPGYVAHNVSLFTLINPWESRDVPVIQKGGISLQVLHSSLSFQFTSIYHIYDNNKQTSNIQIRCLYWVINQQSEVFNVCNVIKSKTIECVCSWAIVWRVVIRTGILANECLWAREIKEKEKDHLLIKTTLKTKLITHSVLLAHSCRNEIVSCIRHECIRFIPKQAIIFLPKMVLVGLKTIWQFV